MTDKEKEKYQKEIINKIPYRKSGRLHILPRVGKSRIIIEIIKRDKYLSVLWVSPSKRLLEKDLKEEYKKWGASKYLNSLTVSTYRSLPKQIGHFDLIVLDEEQHVTINNMKSILSKLTTYNTLLSMTGTPTSIFEKNKIYSRLNLPILVQTDLNEIVEKGIVSDYDITVVELSLNKAKNFIVKHKSGSFVTSEYDRYMYLHTKAEEAVSERNFDSWAIRSRAKFIYESETKLNEAKRLLKNLSGRKLFFCSNIDQAESITNLTYHSKISEENLKRFEDGEIDTLAMVNAGGAGFTFRNVDHLILVQSSNNFNGTSVQKIFRALLKDKDRDKKAQIWVLYLADTVDKVWTMRTLKMFSRNKIKILKDGVYIKN